MGLGDGGILVCIVGQFSRNNFHYFCHILSCIAEISKHLAKRNIGQFNHTLWPSFAQQNVLDKLNIFLRYHQIKMQKRWNSAFHHWRILIWRYLKNLFSLSKIFYGQNLVKVYKWTAQVPNIVFKQMFTCFSCAGQNVASVMDTFRENCPLASMFMKTSSIHAMKFILVVNVLLSFLLRLSMSLIPFQLVLNI